MLNKNNKIGNIEFLGKKRKSPNIKRNIIEGKFSKNKSFNGNRNNKQKEKKSNKRNQIVDSSNRILNKCINKDFKMTNSLNISESNIIKATNDDFKNPIAFFDKFLENKETHSGIIKIIPPKDWKENYDNIFEKVYKKKFLEKDFKFEVRTQILNNLLFGKVIILSK